MTKEDHSARKEVCSAIARLLRTERLKKNLSMSEVAMRAGLSQQMVSYVERELRTPTIDTLFRIVQALEADPLPLLKEAGIQKLTKYPRKH